MAVTGLSSDLQAAVIPGANGVVNAWLMSSVEDVMSNYIQYIYVTDNIAGESYLSEVAFRYDASGNLIETTVIASGGQLDSTLILYDNWGNKIAMDDPVKGVWSYTYNAFGELIEQTSAHGQTQAIMYDSLGRKVRSYQPNVGTRCWYYGNSSAAHNRGRVVRSALHRSVSAMNTIAMAISLRWCEWKQTVFLKPLKPPMTKVLSPALATKVGNRPHALITV